MQNETEGRSPKQVSAFLENSFPTPPDLQPPTHEQCFQDPSKMQSRNHMYLNFIFNHSSKLITECFRRNDCDYADTYDFLVLKSGHGTPGTSLRRTSISLAPLSLSTTRVHENSISKISRQKLSRAEGLIDTWTAHRQQYQVLDEDFWSLQWGASYNGFKDLHRELCHLRDDIHQGKLEEGISRYGLPYLRKNLNEMAISSVRSWYKKWGELDLHRLSSKDAVDIIRRFLRQPPWKEMRIVAGQRTHVGKDHDSGGVLYCLLHTIFGDEEAESRTNESMSRESFSDCVDAIYDCRRYIMDNNVHVTFYSSGAAVLLRKRRLNEKES